MNGNKKSELSWVEKLTLYLYKMLKAIVLAATAKLAVAGGLYFNRRRRMEDNYKEKNQNKSQFRQK